MQVTKKREAFYQKLVTEAVPQLGDRALQNYVAGYEGGTLKAGRISDCAIGHMQADDVNSPRARFKGYNRSRGAPVWGALRRIEIVFEGWGWRVVVDEAPRLSLKERVFKVFMGPLRYEYRLRKQWSEISYEARRDMIYDACVLEMVKRGVEKAPPATQGGDLGGVGWSLATWAERDWDETLTMLAHGVPHARA